MQLVPSITRLRPDTLNRLSVNDSGDQNTYSPNGLNQYQNVAGGDIFYDDKFNLMWTGGFSAGYNSENQLTAVGSGEDYGQFVYDGLGRCVKRTIDWETTLITYDGWQPIVEWNEWNGLKAWNVYGPGPDEILYRHDAYLAIDLRFHLDRMGNIAFVLNAAGEGIERYTYDAFGQPIVTEWNGANPRSYSWYGNRFMFTGREYFPELGLYEFRNRFYYPALGRFLQSDPTGFDAGDANLFRYCGGDPVNGSDPFGLDTNYEAHTSSTEPVNVIGYEIPDNPFADSTTRQSLDVFSNFMHDFNSRGQGRDPGFSLNSAPPTLGVLPLPQKPFASRTRTKVPVVSYTFSFSPKLPRIGTLLGGSLTISRDMYKRYFFSIGPQVGKSPAMIGLAITNNYVYGVDQPSRAQISEMMNGWSWNASLGYAYIGGQVSYPFDAWPWQISSYGGGAMTPQMGYGLNWTTQLTDDDE
jgi:RHS repeat-associated protein